jgi:hypothetical protein
MGTAKHNRKPLSVNKISIQIVNSKIRAGQNVPLQLAQVDGRKSLQIVVIVGQGLKLIEYFDVCLMFSDVSDWFSFNVSFNIKTFTLRR